MPSPRLLTCAFLAAALLPAAGCALPSDGETHVIETAALPLPVATAASPLGSPAEPPDPRDNVSVPARVYFVRDRGIEPVTTIVRTDQVSSKVVADDLLAQLKLGPGIAPHERGLTSRLSGDRRVQVLYITDAVAVVELGPPPDTASETRDGLWTAQVVMTLASLEGIQAVRFTGAEGVDPQVVLPNGKLVTGDITPLMVSSALSVTASRTPVTVAPPAAPVKGTVPATGARPAVSTRTSTSSTT